MYYPIKIALLILLLLLSAFFSSAETALTTVNQLRIQTLAEEGSKSARLLLKIIQDKSKMLSTVLIGNNIVNVFASALMTTLTIDLFGNKYVGIASGVLTLLLLIFGEITPKTLATLHAEKISLLYANIISFLIFITTPLVFLVNKLARFVMFLLRVDPDAQPQVITENELRAIVTVSQEEGVIEKEEKEMIYNVVDFGDSEAKDVMIPRIDMTFISIDAGYEEFIQTFRETMHTRFPIYEESTDDIIGILNVKDVLLSTPENFSIRSFMREAYFTYEHKPTADLLVEMRKAAVSFAIVLDEYGATAGLVTLEDLLEEIVGEIRDEYDTDEEDNIQEIEAGKKYRILGNTKLDEINEYFEWNLESDNYDSIGGYILELLDRLPQPGDEVLLTEHARLCVESLDKNRIDKIYLYL